MTAGYVPRWVPLLEAIRHIQRVAACSLNEASHQLLTALRDGGVKSRHWGVDDTRRLGRDDGIAPTTWYTVAILDDGSAVFSYDGRKLVSDPSHPAYLPSYDVEIRRHDMLRWWPAPSKTAIEEEGAGTEAVALATPAAEPSGNHQATTERPASKTASYEAIKQAVRQRGNATEADLWQTVRQALPDKNVPRSLVRKARIDLYGPPGRKGRPASPNKSPK